MVEYDFIRFKHEEDPGRIVWALSWAVLERISDGKHILITNTHLSDYKKEELYIVLDTIETIREKYPNIPVFSTGDYNIPTDGEEMEAFTQSEYMRNPRTVAEISSELIYNSAHTTDKYPGKQGVVIDHIFFSYDVARALVHDIIVDDVVVCGSDHCPVYVDFAFK